MQANKINQEISKKIKTIADQVAAMALLGP